MGYVEPGSCKWGKVAYTTTIEIEYLQDDEFARKFNSPLTELNDHVIVQVLQFDSPVIGVHVSRLMASSREGPSTPI